jgi:hypothetical protein
MKIVPAFNELEHCLAGETSSRCLTTFDAVGEIPEREIIAG